MKRKDGKKRPIVKDAVEGHEDLVPWHKEDPNKHVVTCTAMPGGSAHQNGHIPDVFARRGLSAARLPFQLSDQLLTPDRRDPASAVAFIAKAGSTGKSSSRHAASALAYWALIIRQFNATWHVSGNIVRSGTCQEPSILSFG